VFGLHQASGTVEVEGREMRIRSPRQAMQAGIGFVPADRKLQGLVLSMSVRENLVMASSAGLGRFRHPSASRELDSVRTTISDLDIRVHSPRVPVATLSGGNQQKVVLGKWLATDPKVLMLDEPTRGVDVGAKAEIYRLLFEASQRGIAILLSSSETPELQTLCDRILVVFRGKIAASLSRAEASEARIAHFAGGHQ
jgi:ABC-type sugar transport system ATPase subunit